MQKNYGGFWSGPSGSDSVAIFGGNQGAGVLQKITWFFGIVLIFGSLFLSIYQASSSQVSAFYIQPKTKTITEETSQKNAENKEEENQFLDKIEFDTKKLKTEKTKETIAKDKQVEKN